MTFEHFLAGAQDNLPQVNTNTHEAISPVEVDKELW